MLRGRIKLFNLYNLLSSLFTESEANASHLILPFAGIRCAAISQKIQRIHLPLIGRERAPCFHIGRCWSDCKNKLFYGYIFMWSFFLQFKLSGQNILKLVIWFEPPASNRVALISSETLNLWKSSNFYWSSNLYGVRWWEKIINIWMKHYQ